jgi:hypothetical protein
VKDALGMHYPYGLSHVNDMVHGCPRYPWHMLMHMLLFPYL